MSSPHDASSGESTKKGSRWDRRSKDDGTDEASSKRKLPSNADSTSGPDGEPDVKKASMNTEGIDLSMGPKDSSKISVDLAGSAATPLDLSTTKTSGPIKLSLGNNKPKEPAPAAAKPKTVTVAQAFNDDESSDEEEMPPEAKMRMRNLGKDTPTAAGPNSFGKNRLGFCDRQKVIQRELQKKMDDMAKE